MCREGLKYKRVDAKPSIKIQPSPGSSLAAKPREGGRQGRGEEDARHNSESTDGQRINTYEERALSIPGREDRKGGRFLHEGTEPGNSLIFQAGEWW